MPQPDSVGHAIGSDGSHDAQALQSWLVLPFLRELLLFRTLRFNKFLPPFCRPLNIPIQVSEFLHGWESLEKFKEGLQNNNPTRLWMVFLTLLTAQVLLHQKGHSWSLGTTARNLPGSDFVHSPFPNSVVTTSQEQESTRHICKATGKNDWGQFHTWGRSSELKGVSRLPTALTHINAMPFPSQWSHTQHPGLLPCSTATETWEFGSDNTGKDERIWHHPQCSSP